MYKYNGYQVVYSEQSLNKLKKYKEKLENKQKNGALTPSKNGPGKRLKDLIGNRNLSEMDILIFLNLLLATKKPSIFIESAKLHYEENWSQEEISLLGDIVVATKTTVYHDGKRGNGSGTKVATSYNKQERFMAHLLFVSGALLRQSSKGKNEGSPDITEVIINGKLDVEKLYQLYTRRLLPALLHANAVTTSKQGAYVTIPGIGCGQFIDTHYCSKDELKKIVAGIIKRILKENVDQLPNIRAVRFDPNTNGPEGLSCSIKGKKETIDYIVANSMKQGLLHKPEYFGKKYKGCDYFKVVAWDHSYPGNDWIRGSGATDDGSNFAGTDAGYQLTRAKGKYGQTSNGQNGYLPPSGYATWGAFIEAKKIFMRVDAKNLYITTKDGGHARSLLRLIIDAATQNSVIDEKLVVCAINNLEEELFNKELFNKEDIKLVFDLKLKKVIGAFLDKNLWLMNMFLDKYKQISLSDCINVGSDNLAVLKILCMVDKKQNFTKQHLIEAIKKKMPFTVHALCEQNPVLVDVDVLKLVNELSKEDKRWFNILKKVHYFYSDYPKKMSSSSRPNEHTKCSRFKDTTGLMKFSRSEIQGFFEKYKKDLISFSQDNKEVQKGIKSMLALFEKIINAASFESFENDLFGLCRLLFIPKKGNKLANFFGKQPQPALLLQIEELNNKHNHHAKKHISKFCAKMKTEVFLPREYISSYNHVKALYSSVLDGKFGEELNKLDNNDLYYPAKFTKSLEMLKSNFNFIMSYENDGYIVWAPKEEHDKLQKMIDDFNNQQGQKKVIKL